MIDCCADCGATIHEGDRIVYRPSIEIRDAFVTICGACEQKESIEKKGAWKLPWKRPGKRCWFCGNRVRYIKNETAWFCALESHPGLYVRVCNACAGRMAGNDDDE